MSVGRLMATAAGGLMIALAAVPISPLQAQANPADIQFISNVSSDHLLEVRLGDLAGQKAVNPAVKQFAQKMVQDHGRLQDQLTSIASSSGLFFRPALKAEQEQQVSQLSSLSGPDFDRAYMTAMIQGHQNAVSYFQNEGRSVQSTRLQQYVTSTLPILQEHLSLAQQTGSQVGATTVAAANPPPAPVPAPAPTPTVQANQNPQVTAQQRRDVRNDFIFIREVVADNYLTVQVGRIAMQRGDNSMVRQYGQVEDKDHNRLQDEWLAMASNNGLQVQPGMGKNHRKKLQEIQKASKQNFDRVYMTLMVKDHQAYLIDYLTRGRQAHSAPVRELVERTIPVLRQHFTEAKRIGAQVGADTAATLPRERVSSK